MSSETDKALINYISEAVKMLKLYDPDKFSFSSWEKRFLNVVKTLNVPDSKKATFFCSMLDYKTYTSLKRHLSPRHPRRLSYEDLVKNLKTCPSIMNTRNVRMRFKARKQDDEETIEKYAKYLKYMYKKCQYQCADERILVDQFLYGLSNREIASHLKKAKISVYKVAVRLALELEKKDKASTSKD